MTGEASDADYLHDVFLAHATADNSACLKLYDALDNAGVHVFMDVKGLDAASEWDVEIPEHQRQSRLTLVFVSSNTSKAWFQREEITQAIAQRRFGDRPHFILPVWAAGHQRPYGLRVLSGIDWQDSEEGVAAVVSATLAVLKKKCGVIVADRFHASGLPPFLTTGLLRRRGKQSSPFQLLVASRQVVEFGGRTKELAELDAWADEPGVSVKLLHGPGGTGKTRLILEWLQRRRDSGDMAGLLKGDASSLVALLDRTVGRAIVALDYAESRAGLAELVAAAANAWGAGRGGLKILLVARHASDWWRKLREEGDVCSFLDEWPPLFLPLHVGGTPESEFQRARRAFSEALGEPPRSQATMPERLREERILSVHIAALLDVLGTAESDPNRLLDGLLERERRFWRKQSADGTTEWPERERVFEQAFAALTLRGGARTREELALWLPAVAGSNEKAFRALLEEHYDGTSELWRAPVQPDVVGEHLVWVALRGGAHPAGPPPGAGLVETIMKGDAPPWAAAFTVLARAEPQHAEEIGPWLETLLATDPLARALPALEGVLAAGATIAHGLLGARLARCLATSGSIRLAVEVNMRIPEATVMLRELALWATQKQFQEESDPVTRAKLANNLSNRLSELGHRAEALKASEEAVLINKQVETVSPKAVQPELATSQHTMGLRLSELGRYEEALTLTDEAVEIRRNLALTDPRIYISLSTTLTNRGMILANLGRHDDAVRALQEAESLYAGSATSQPEALAGLAGSLNNLGVTFAQLGRRVEALEATQKALRIRIELAKTRPDAYLPSVVTTRGNIGLMLSELNRHDEALTELEEAKRVVQQLARNWGDAFDQDVAMILNNLGFVLGKCGRLKEALEHADQAVEICRRLASRWPQVFSGRLDATLRLRELISESMGRQA